MTALTNLVAAFAVLSVFTCVFYYLHHEGEFWKQDDSSSLNVLGDNENHTGATTNNNYSSLLDTVDESVLTELRGKLLNPKPLLISNDNSTSLTYVPHQFLHLHHMKTGGTSLENLIRCGMQRFSERIPFKNLHECGVSHYNQCKTGKDAACLKSVKQAAVMSYCAPMSDLQNPFQWLDEDGTTTDNVSPPYAAVTVLRHPVDRVWSMYRYQTRSCYQCRPLKEVYEEIDKSSLNWTMSSSNTKENCNLQLLNHQTRNLLLHDNLMEDGMQVQQAVQNMKSFFTITGLTEELTVTAQMIGKVFPWLAETVTLDDVMLRVVGDNNSSTVGFEKKKLPKCQLEHTNKSPLHNPCGELPSKPDAETAKIILEHNQLDLHIYEQAVKHFELQRAVMGL